jgi:hypothetical protein
MVINIVSELCLFLELCFNHEDRHLFQFSFSFFLNDFQFQFWCCFGQGSTCQRSTNKQAQFKCQSGRRPIHGLLGWPVHGESVRVSVCDLFIDIIGMLPNSF